MELWLSVQLQSALPLQTSQRKIKNTQAVSYTHLNKCCPDGRLFSHSDFPVVLHINPSVIRCVDVYKRQSYIRQLPELPDAFICANDFVAMDLIKALKQCGLSRCV